MIRSSSSNDINTISFLDCLDDSRINQHLIIFIRIGADQLPHHSRLLVNFLQHVVRISAFADIRQIQLSCIATPFKNVTIVILHFYTISRHDNQLFIMDFHIFAGLTNHSHSIGTDHVIAFAQANQKRRFVLGNVDRRRILGIYQGKSVGTFDNVKGLAESVKNREAVFFRKFPNQMNCNFCICLPFKIMASKIVIFDIQVIFNHTVVNQNKTACLRGVGMGVILTWFPVGCPAGMSNTC